MHERSSLKRVFASCKPYNLLRVKVSTLKESWREMDRYVQILTRLDLTTIQAKVFLILLENGISDTKRISTIGKFDRANAYKAAIGLERRGLVMRHIGTPTSFEAIPITQAVSLMTKHKANEFKSIQNNAKHLLQKYADKNNRQLSLQKDEYFIVMPGKHPFYKKWEKVCKTASKTTDVIATERREPQDTEAIDILKQIVKRGVKSRVLWDRSDHDDEEFKMRVKQIEDVLGYPNLTVKYSFFSTKPYVAIIDDALGIITIDQTRFFKTSRTLWTNNPNLILALKEHFETVWDRAQLYIPPVKEINSLHAK
jgi:sugar-specific transcriptional regulator TrmB